LHDWVPLGRLNDVAAARAADPDGRLARTTLIHSAPFTIGLAYSCVYSLGSGAYPGWLWWFLWISYGLLFIGELTAWWIPYLFRPDPSRAARYRSMFGNTQSFLPERNGITPNTLHCVLHLATVATLVVLWLDTM
jgi:hypothetical protein